MTGEGVAATSERLVGLLSQPGPYRERWLRHDRRHRGGVNQSAVANVLSEYLWDTGQVPEHDIALPRRLKDRVSRAISGRALSPALLRLFVEAFEMTELDAQSLWGLLLDSGTDAPLLVPLPSTQAVAGPEPHRAFETVALHEYHVIGADRCPVEHRTVQVLRAIAPLTTYRYRFDTNAAVVQVLRGGAAASVLADEASGLYAVDIVLTTPLEPGATASLEYRTVFSYHAPPEPVFRRVSLRRTTNVDLNVRFECPLPERLEWCAWDTDDLDAEPVHVEPVPLATDRSAHRFLDVLERAGAGFRWAWAAT